jgi:hypothetical protein
LKNLGQFGKRLGAVSPQMTDILPPFLGRSDHVVTEGLASDLIDQWSRRLKLQIEEKKSKLLINDKEKSGSFYYRKNIKKPPISRKSEINDFVFCVTRNENNAREPPKKKPKLTKKFEDDEDESIFSPSFYSKE